MRYIFTLLLSFLVVMGANAQIKIQKSLPNTNQNQIGNIGIAPIITVEQSSKDMVQVPSLDLHPSSSYYNVQKNRGDVTIGTGTLTDQRYPIYAYWGYSYSQSIYYASEIGMPGTITKIQYYFNGASLANSDDWTIYMGHTTKTVNASTTDWVPLASLTQVYSGTITWAAGSWIEITLTTPFVYNGTDNLVIAVDENKANYDGTNDRFYCTTVTGNRSMMFYSDSQNPDPANPPTASYNQSVIPNIIISITPVITNQHDLTLSSITIPSTIENNASIAPKATVSNYGFSEEATYDVNMTIKDASNNVVYNQTVSNPGNIVSAGSLLVTFPDWTPTVTGNYTLTATVTLTGDEDNTNNDKTKNTSVMDFVTAFAWNAYHTTGAGVTGTGPINIILQTGAMSQIAVNAGNFIAGADYVNLDLYGVQYAASPAACPLVKINPITGEVTTIGGGIASLTGLAYDVTTGNTYVMDINGVLYTIDLNTGATTTIGGSFASAIGLACDQNGNLFAISVGTDNLASIDKTTGAATAIGPLGVNINYAQDIAFDRDNNVLYGSLYTTTGGLYTINTTTGAATLVATVADELTGFAIPYTVLGAEITFAVTDGANPVEGATVTIGAKILTTDAQGEATTFLTEDTHNFTVTKYGFQDYPNSVTVVDGVPQTVNVPLTALPVYNATITVNNTATKAPIEGADVVVKYGTEIVAQGQTNASGQFVATNLINGDFTFTATATGYQAGNGNFTVTGADATASVTLTEIVWAPYGLLGEQLTGGDVLFTWNNDIGFSDDFESYTDFEYQTIGEYTLYDGDGVASYGFQSYDFPNESYTGSYIIFNPSLCTPALTSTESQPHSGSKYIACFNATASPWNNDWLITKQITAANGMKFSFWASTFELYQVGEQFKVGVSTTNTDPGSFTFISPLVTVPVGWTYYEYDLSAYAGQNIYLAINCLSQDEFILMIDDLEVGMGKKAPMPVVSYSVSLNGDPEASGITGTSYTYQGLTPGDYTFGVKGVFATGESDESLMNFTVTGTKELGSSAVIYPNPTSDFVKIQAKGNYNVKIVDVNGKVVLNQNANNSTNVDLRSLPNGVYMLQMTFDKDQTKTKIIKK